ncbi:hypothetical protein GE061_012202, partial [Apolygus lucorum]
MPNTSNNGTVEQRSEESTDSPVADRDSSSEPEKSPKTASAVTQETQLDPSKVEYVDGKCFYT